MEYCQAKSFRRYHKSFLSGILGLRNQVWLTVILSLAFAPNFVNGQMTKLTVPPNVPPLIAETCLECHNRETSEGGLDLTALAFKLDEPIVRERWVRIHDRIAKREMPPQADDLPVPSREKLLKQLATALHDADHADIVARGRGPFRRLNRDEFQQNLRDLLQLPHLDIRDLLPADRESFHFNKTSQVLDISRVQLAAYLDATEFALRQAVVTSKAPPEVTHYRAVGTQLFSHGFLRGGREAMFFVRDNKASDIDEAKYKVMQKKGENDLTVDLAIFRSPGWPYSAYPQGFVAKERGQYRVRFSAKAVLQGEGLTIKPAQRPQPMTFRSRKPTNHDIPENLQATGGIIDISPDGGVYETIVYLDEGQTVEYGLLGLPVPRIDGGRPGVYRFPPFPAGGQPGATFQWLEIVGPLVSPSWPPSSQRVLFDDIDPAAMPAKPRDTARRLLRRFLSHAICEPVSDAAVQNFEKLIFSRLDQGESFTEAMLAGYQAVLCSGLFLYLPEPKGEDEHAAIATRLSHFLTNGARDHQLRSAIEKRQLRQKPTLKQEAERLIASEPFERFITQFTDYWLDLRHLRRDDPDIRFFPEYRMDDYLVESLERETRTFVMAMFRDNLPIQAIIESDFVYANDRLADHYQLPPLTGSALRKVQLPADSPYGGLLTQGAILKVTANGSATSPVVRGAWVMDRLLGQPAPPPPPGVPAVEPDTRGAKTIRELLALHTKSTTCASCHAKFDPVGLALENFDVMGAWRTRYRGLVDGERITGIDRAGHDFSYTIAGNVDPRGQLADGTRFQNVRELKQHFAKQPRQLARNLLHQLIVYATGTPVRFADRRELELILDQCAVEDYRTRDLLLALVQSKIFLGEPGSR